MARLELLRQPEVRQSNVTCRGDAQDKKKRERGQTTPKAWSGEVQGESVADRSRDLPVLSMSTFSGFRSLPCHDVGQGRSVSGPILSKSSAESGDSVRPVPIHYIPVMKILDGRQDLRGHTRQERDQPRDGCFSGPLREGSGLSNERSLTSAAKKQATGSANT